jgi:hypothetical protein
VKLVLVRTSTRISAFLYSWHVCHQRFVLASNMNHSFNYVMQMAEQARDDVRRREIHYVERPTAPGNRMIRLRNKDGPIEFTTVRQPKYELGRLHAYAKQAVKLAVTEREMNDANAILHQCRQWENNSLGPLDQIPISDFARGKASVRRAHNWV